MQLTKSARALARQPGRQLTLVRKRTQPTAVYIARLTATATFAYLLALQVPAGTSRPVLAPLTALLVLQASLFQTIRSGIRKVISVIAGVLIAVALSALVGFSWWLLALLIAGALALGQVLRLGDDMLEVPISAMLIFASAGLHAAATGRIVDTLVGTVAGLVGGLVFAPVRIQSAREAVGELADRLAGLLDQMAGDLTDGFDPARANDWLSQTGALRGEIERVDDTLRQAEESVRLNPRTLRTTDALPDTEVALRGGLESLEHATLRLRGLARSVLDSSRIATAASPIRDEQTRAQLAEVLTSLGAAIRTYGRLVQTLPSGNESLETDLATHLEEVHKHQDQLAELLEPRTAPDGGSSEWPLRGEILSHVDHLRTGLNVEDLPRHHPQRRLRRQHPDRRERGGRGGRTIRLHKPTRPQRPRG
jgi:Aromatic acid exporter family member 1